MEQTEIAPLTQYRIVGMIERVYQAAPGAPRQSGGSCWHCGTAITNCVVIQNTETDEKHEIGTTCAERVGLPKSELKKLLAEKYAQERYEHSAAVQRQRKAEWERKDAQETAQFGEHGTESRFISGCRCGECVDAAPHGYTQRFYKGCWCLSCIEAVMAQDDSYFFAERWVLIDLATGEPAKARIVDGDYGSVWCVTDANDRAIAWVNPSPKRYSTIAKKGYTEAHMPFLVERCGRRGDEWYKNVCPMGSAIVDDYGQSVPHKEAS